MLLRRPQWTGLVLVACWIGSGAIAIGQEPPPVEASPAPGVETWEVDTRACEQVMGSSPWASLAVSQFDEGGRTLVRSDAGALLARMAGRPVVLLIHGNNYEDDESLTEAIEVRDRLASLGGLPGETLFVIFDWPSERTLRSLVKDLNEKARRSRVAAYHLARFLQASPAGARRSA